MKSILYKIVCNDVDSKKIYIGECKCLKRLKKRMHRKLVTRLYTKKEMKLYLYIEKNKGIQNFTFIEIDEKDNLENIIQKYKPELNNITEKYIKVNCNWCNRINYILKKDKKKEYYKNEYYCKIPKIGYMENCEEKMIEADEYYKRVYRR